MNKIRLFLAVLFVFTTILAINLVSAAEINFSCNIDSDCVLEVPSARMACNQCDPYQCKIYDSSDESVLAVNKNWKAYCPKNESMGLCAACQGGISNKDKYETKCISNRCEKVEIGASIDNSYQNISSTSCKIDQDCPNNLQCQNFPEYGLRCSKPDPCSYFSCPSGTECTLTESYPPSIICGKTCTGEDCEETTSHENIKPEEAKIIAELPNGEVTLQNEGEKDVYIVKGIKQGKLFLLFNVESNVEIKIDAKEANIISENKPWWSFLVRGI